MVWYPLFAHVLDFPKFQKFQIIPCYLRVLRHWHMYIASGTLLTMVICVHDLDSAVLYAFLQVGGKTTALNLERNYVYEAFILAAYGFWQLIFRVTKL